MVCYIELVLEGYNTVMVVTAIVKSLRTCILEYNALVCVWSKAVSRCHITDISIAEALTVLCCTARYIPVVTE